MLENPQLVDLVVQNAQRMILVLTPDQELEESERNAVDQIKNALIGIALPSAILDGELRLDHEFRAWAYPVDPRGLSYFSRAVLDEAGNGMRTYGYYNDRALHLTRQNIATDQSERYQGLLGASWVDTITNPTLMKLKFTRGKNKLLGNPDDFDRRMVDKLTQIEWDRLAQSGHGLLQQTGLTALIEKTVLLQELEGVLNAPHSEGDLRDMYYRFVFKLLDEQERAIFFHAHETLSVLMGSRTMNLMRALL
jgi:hypothetical protein